MLMWKHEMYLELDEELRKRSMHLRHKLIHELRHFSTSDSLSAKTEVQRVIKELLVVCAEIKADRNGGLRPYACNNPSDIGQG